MADTINGVANEAARSSMVAQSSVAIAKNGANVVRDTIGGMNTIREQIQDTSKRIKRLGESSQEIGDIVSLINDIADQTNILSLNAAIQASMAGDAGRGFAVVADEVQRLAERSSAATKQIEALVKTIQTDTNEAVISMEQTTTEVVHGARLAEDAGVALEEIETVSADIAKLIQDISDSARQQSGKATSVSDRMNVIQDITTQTSSGTAKTAESIGKLTALSSSMRDSVTGFTLPEEFVNQAAANEESGELDVLSESDDEASVDAAMYDTVSELGEFDAAEEDYDLENETVEEALEETVVEESLEKTVQMQNLEGDEEVSFEEMEDDTALSDQTVMLAESTLESLEAPVEEPHVTEQLDVTEEVASSLDDDDDEFELDLEDADEELAPAPQAKEVAEKPAEDDELVLDMDDDFDLDLDEFSFDDDSDKSSK
jgi:twitching motility protein PilJ